MKWLLFISILLLPHCGSSIDIEWPDEDLSSFNASPTPQEWFRIIVVDVGQGDGVILLSPENKIALIDTGPPQIGDAAILKILNELQLDKIESVFISHYDQDHSGGLEAIQSTSLGQDARLIDHTSTAPGDRFKLGSVHIQVLGGDGKIGRYTIPNEKRNERNYLSLALLIRYKHFRYFTDGDLPGGGGRPPYQTLDLETPLAPLVGDVDILLVPHHGSHTSTHQTLLDSLRPEVAILSLGDENEHFHPHPSVMRRLKEAGIQIFQTNRGWLREKEGVEVVGGSICIVTDGKEYLVKPYAIDKCAPPPYL